MATLTLEFGLLCLQLSEQLDQYGVAYGQEEIECFQKDIDALNRLRLRHLIPPSQLNKAEDKLGKSVFEHIHLYNEGGTSK